MVIQGARVKSKDVEAAISSIASASPTKHKKTNVDNYF